MTNKTDKNSRTTRAGAQLQIEQASTPNHNAGQQCPYPVIFTYGRKQALADGVQVDVSKTAAEAGFKIPMFLTHSVFNEYVKVPEGVACQDEEGRLWDVVWMLRYAVASEGAGTQSLEFKLYVRNSNDKPAELVTLAAQLEAMDFDDPCPVITVSLPGED